MKKSIWRRSLVSGLLILVGQGVITLGQAHGTPQFVPMLYVQVGALLVGFAELLRRQKSDPVVGEGEESPD